MPNLAGLAYEKGSPTPTEHGAAKEEAAGADRHFQEKTWDPSGKELRGPCSSLLRLGGDRRLFAGRLTLAKGNW
eukprot:CAMPEP_0206449486 /NCGR_PEP_ID=MMETSP0324_2-20121206/18114_1 /ASSEMBLY_ACC=CAM_ASM_000836 /TAXON_ID=2866 /ORGANISM="Crypthecodinium cohnii, Strain Seligo" /LENGTH=73 /DNA_ID=CAMNT_0053918865 /DNA_START=412 /DNA_END=630 /DNA_ORIENTATION=-